MLVLFALLSVGCTYGALARRLVRAPNLQQAPNQEYAKFARDFMTVSVPIGPLEGGLKASVVEPGNWNFEYSFVPKKTQKKFTADIHLSFEKPNTFMTEPKGTVFLLHGFGQQKEQMLHWALSLAQQGFRCILVDLRGHGASSGEWIGYGAFEVADLKSLLDALSARQLIAGRIGVMGVSLGASVALQWAGADARIATVVALEPFADPRLAISTMLHNFPPFRRQLWWASEGTISRAIDEAPKLAGFQWVDVDVPKSVKGIQGPILLIHGADDVMVPSNHSQILRMNFKSGSRFVIVPGQDHITLALCLSPISETVHEWMNQHLAEKP